MNKKYDIFPALFWVGLSIFVAVFSHRLGLGNFQNPGPGLMPFLVGIALLLASAFIVVRSFLDTRKRNDLVEKVAAGRRRFWKVGLVLGLLFAYGVVLEKLGYLVSTSLLLIFLFRIAGSQKWRSIVAASVLTVVLTYLVFNFLGLRFPLGIFKG